MWVEHHASSPSHRVTLAPSNALVARHLDVYCNACKFHLAVWIAIAREQCLGSPEGCDRDLLRLYRTMNVEIIVRMVKQYHDMNILT
jgi:hypothetical protein